MTDHPTMAALTGGVGLLERAISYTLGSLRMVTPAAMDTSTPCVGWDLRALLAHMNDSLLALQQAADLGHIDLDSTELEAPSALVADPVGDPVGTLRSRACRLLGAWTNLSDPEPPMSVADVSMSSSIVAGTGAVEVVIHGWDVARACGVDRPIPEPLAEELLPLVPLLVGTDDRPTRFAEPIELPVAANLGDHLLGFLGRDPR